jgi:hypothetical protein
MLYSHCLFFFAPILVRARFMKHRHVDAAAVGAAPLEPFPLPRYFKVLTVAFIQVCKCGYAPRCNHCLFVKICQIVVSLVFSVSFSSSSQATALVFHALLTCLVFYYNPSYTATLAQARAGWGCAVAVGQRGFRESDRQERGLDAVSPTSRG